MVDRNNKEKKCRIIADKIRLDLIELGEKVNNTMHWGGDLSCVEILAVLYGEIMNCQGDDFEHNDKFLLSKGHAGASLYATLYEVGILRKSELMTYQEDGTALAELAEYNPQLGIEVSGGSLGLGLSYGVGLALLAKKKQYDYHTYILVGDGELDEGSVWEAAMSASQFSLDNITVIIDNNGAQSDGSTVDIMSMENLKERFEVFGWAVDVVNGHKCKEIIDSILDFQQRKPHAIIANTIKGKGVSFMENNNEWHDKRLQGDKLVMARKEIETIVKNRF